MQQLTLLGVVPACCPSPRIPSLSVPAWQGLAATTGHSNTAQSPGQGRGRQAAEGSQHWPPTLLSAQLSPDGAEGQVGAAMVVSPEHPQKANQPSPCPDGSTGHFGPFLVTLGGAPGACAGLPPHPPPFPAKFQHSHSFCNPH